MSENNNAVAIDNECFAHAVTRNRKYAVYTSRDCTGLDNALHYIRMALHYSYEFDEDATQLEVKDCILLVLFKGFAEHVIISYQEKQVSVALIDMSLAPYIEPIIRVLNTATLSSWEPLELTTNLVAAFLVVYLDGSLNARVKLQVETNADYRAKLEIGNEFVDNALIEVARDDHFIKGVGLVEQAILYHLSKLNFRMGRISSLKIRNKLKISRHGHLSIHADEFLIDLTKYVSHAVQVPSKLAPRE